MNRKDIRIVRMECASIIHSPQNFISYDHNAGEKAQPIKCITTFWAAGGFIKDLLDAKIVSVRIMTGNEKEGYASFILVLNPEFGFTNQKIEDIFFELFEKYNL